MTWNYKLWKKLAYPLPLRHPNSLRRLRADSRTVYMTQLQYCQINQKLHNKMQHYGYWISVCSINKDRDFIIGPSQTGSSNSTIITHPQLKYYSFSWDRVKFADYRSLAAFAGKAQKSSLLLWCYCMTFLREQSADTMVYKCWGLIYKRLPGWDERQGHHKSANTNSSWLN